MKRGGGRGWAKQGRGGGRGRTIVMERAKGRLGRRVRGALKLRRLDKGV